MVKSILKWAFVWILSSNAFSGGFYHYFGDPNDLYQKALQADQQLIEAKPDLAALQQQYPDDKEILSGLAFLYQRNSALLGDGMKYNPAEPLDFALKIDPQDKPSLFLKTYLDVMMYNIKRYSDLEQSLKGQIENAAKRNTNALISQGSHLSGYFKEELEKAKTQKGRFAGRYEITDPNQAIAQVKAVLDQEAHALLKSIQAARSIDDNAGYNYMKANIYLLLNDTKNAIGKLEDGSQKQLTTYLNIQNERIQKVLDAIGFPKTMQFYILYAHNPFESIIRMMIWEEGLEQYTAEQEKQGNYQEAKRVYRLLEHISEQCQPEQVRSMNLGALMKRKIEEVQKKNRLMVN